MSLPPVIPVNAKLTRRNCLLPPLVGLGLLSISQQVRAGNQLEEPLIDSVRTALSSAVRNAAPPIPVFSSTEARLQYLRWLGAMSERLQKKKKDFDTRKEF